MRSVPWRPFVYLLLTFTPTLLLAWLLASPDANPAITVPVEHLIITTNVSLIALLIVERERSLEACGIGTCHTEALWLWVAILIVGTVFIPAVFAVALKPYRSAR